MLEINSLQEFSDKDLLLQSIAKQFDVEIDQLKKYITHGWPRHIPNRMLLHSKSPHEYTIQAEIVYRGFCVVPPRHLGPHILHTLHCDHPGIVHTICLARQYFWWPGIDTSINAFVQRCHMCQVNAHKWMSQHLRSWEDTQGFLEQVHIDINHYRDCWYPIFINAYSKWVVILLISSLSTLVTITALCLIFKYVGIPITLVSDNSMNFVSNKFEAFLSDNFIAHVCTPLGHQSVEWSGGTHHPRI